MKKKIYIIVIMCFLLIPVCGINAQNLYVAESDTSAINSTQMVDSLFINKDIFDILPSKERGDRFVVNIYQSTSIVNALRNHISANSNRDIYGYRVRIFFDNQQNARENSESMVNSFKRQFKYIPAYRSFQSPFFKVAVGDFRNKSDAIKLLEMIKANYPSAFVVKERINYPIVDLEYLYK